MKKFIQLVAAIKAAASLAFTAGIMLITVGAMLLGQNAIPTSIIWQAVFLALIFGTLQFLAFTDHVFPRMGTAGRMAFLCLSMLAVLALFALVFRWFPAGHIASWAIFLGLYAAVFAIATIALRIVFRVGELTYNDSLAAYKTKRREG